MYRFLFLHILVNMCYFASPPPIFYYSHFNEYEVVFHWDLICIFLVTNGIEYLFICSLAICISSLKKHLLNSLPTLNWIVCLFVVEL